MSSLPGMRESEGGRGGLGGGSSFEKSILNLSFWLGLVFSLLSYSKIILH